MDSVVIFGAGGHARVVCDLIEAEGKHRVFGFVDQNSKQKELLGYPVFCQQDDVKNLNIFKGVIAVGDGATRKKIALNILKSIPSFQFVNAIHPTAHISKHSVIGAGAVLMAGAVVNPGAKIGDHVLVNTSASVDHDCILEDFSGVGPGVYLGGNVHLGDSSYIGIGSTLIQGIRVGDHTIVGAGSLLLEDAKADSIYYGSPAKLVSKRDFSKKYF